MRGRLQRAHRGSGHNSGNGYRSRRWDTRVGTIDLAISKLRSGTYYPDWLLIPRRRAEQALVSVIGQAYVEGVSTRRVDDLVKAMGIEGISPSEVSRMAAELDVKVVEFRERPLEGDYRYLWIDALTQRVREGGRVVNVSALIATAVKTLRGAGRSSGSTSSPLSPRPPGVSSSAPWSLGGLSGVELVISDAHGGIKAAIAQVVSEASRQRCRTSFHGQPGLPGLPRRTGR